MEKLRMFSIGWVVMGEGIAGAGLISKAAEGLSRGAWL
jgi:hypothetical protein